MEGCSLGQLRSKCHCPLYGGHASSNSFFLPHTGAPLPIAVSLHLGCSTSVSCHQRSNTSSDLRRAAAVTPEVSTVPALKQRYPDAHITCRMSSELLLPLRWVHETCTRLSVQGNPEPRAAIRLDWASLNPIQNTLLLTILVKHGTTARDKGRARQQIRLWGIGEMCRNRTFPVRFGSFTCVLLNKA